MKMINEVVLPILCVEPCSTLQNIEQLKYIQKLWNRIYNCILLLLLLRINTVSKKHGIFYDTP